MSKKMNCNIHNLDQSLSEMEVQYDDKIQANSNSDELHQMNKEINDIKSKLLECQKEYEYTEVEIHNVNQLKDKGIYVLNNVERNYNNLDEELKQIHCNYVKCIEKVNSDNDIIQQRINSLTMQRDNLRKKLDELKKTTDENNKKLIEIKNMIIIQEKKNIALIRKLKRITENVYITPDLRRRVNMILMDSRFTNIKNSNYKI